MDIKYKLYPHPVLWDKNDDYVSSKFSCDVDIKREIRKFLININFHLYNKELKEMLKNGQAEYILHIECPSTSYRVLVKSKEDKTSIKLADERLLGRISLCPFIVAKEDLIGYSNENFNNDYLGVKFDLQRGTILAIGDQFKFIVNKDNEELCEVPSIFTIYKKETVEDIGMEVELNCEKIRIGFNINDYENYSLIVSSMPNMIDVVNSSILFPVLIYIFEQLKYNFDEYESSNYRWFNALKKIFNRYSINFNYDLFDAQSSIILAQKIMDMPISKALLSIKNIDDISEDE